jgi:hypothetical protein
MHQANYTFSGIETRPLCSVENKLPIVLQQRQRLRSYYLHHQILMVMTVHKDQMTIFPVLLTPGETDADNNFIDSRPGVVCGNVSDDTGLYISSVEIRLYIDGNANGTYDVGEILYAFTYTDGDTGDYTFEDVPPGLLCYC